MICAEFHSHALGAAPLKCNFSLNSFPETCEVLASAEGFNSVITSESGGVSQLSLGCVLLGRIAVFLFIYRVQITALGYKNNTSITFVCC